MTVGTRLAPWMRKMAVWVYGPHFREVAMRFESCCFLNHRCPIGEARCRELFDRYACQERHGDLTPFEKQSLLRRWRLMGGGLHNDKQDTTQRRERDETDG